MALWTEDEIKEWLSEAIDRDRLKAVQIASVCAATGKWETDVGAVNGDAKWPYYQDYVYDHGQAGRANKTLNSGRLVMSRILSSDIEPETTLVLPETNLIRKGCWRHRARGDHAGDGGWATEIESHFLDFRMLGAGSSFYAYKYDAEERQYVSLANVRQTDVVWSRNCRHPGSATEVCYRVLVPYRQALAMMQKAKVAEAEKACAQASIFTAKDGDTTNVAKTVPFLVFYSARQPGREPTRAVMIGDSASPVFLVKPEENKVGRIPWNTWENFLPPGCRWPMGSIYMESTIQTAFDQINDYWRSFLNNPPFAGINDECFVPGDIKKVLEGKRSFARLKKDLTKAEVDAAIVQYRGGEMQETVMAYKADLDREYATVAGLSDMDRNQMLSSQRTLGEINHMQAAGQQNRAFDERKVAKGLAGLVETVFHGMAMFDRSPFVVDVDGYDFTVNDPNDPRTWMDEVMREPGEVVIDPGALTGADNRQRSLERAMTLVQFLGQMVGKYVNPEKFIDELLTILGEPDSDEWKMMPPPMQAAAGQLAQTAVTAAQRGQNLPAVAA